MGNSLLGNNEINNMFLGKTLVDKMYFNKDIVFQRLAIGEEYEGGYIYYVTGSYPNYSGYIISKEESTIADTCWGCYGIRVTDARSPGIGAGETNTNNIVGSGCGGCGAPVGSAPTAAQASLNYSGSGFTDWWLPTTGDWQAIFANKSKFNFLTSSFEYWTSRENALLNDGLYFGYTAKWFNPSTSGSIQSRSKDSGLYFRAARAFTYTTGSI
jgi:hypothetical protein